MENSLPRLILILKIFVGLIIIIGLLLYGLKLIEPFSPPQNIIFSNITDHQATISWTTAKATKGAILVSKNGKFPILPLFTTVYKDDGEKNLNRMRFYTTHKVTMDNLNPKTNYKFRIYQGWKKVYEGSFNTGPTLQSISTPNPVYGKIVGADKKTPVVGALVYLQASSSAVLSTLTNTQGGWSVDLGNLRTKDLKMIYPVASGSGEFLVVETGKGRFKAETLVGQDKPWPDIILK